MARAVRWEDDVMKVSVLLGKRGLACCLLAVATLSPTPATAAEPDRLVRAYLGISSIPVRFPAPKDKKYCYLAIAKFQDGKFLGYAERLLPPIEIFNQPNYEAELGWAEKDGKYGYFLTTPGASQGFQADEFFRGFGATQYLALGQASNQTLGPFSVLGFAVGGEGVTALGAKAGDVRDVIRGKFRVVVFLMSAFETQDQAREFGGSLPKLSPE